MTALEWNRKYQIGEAVFYVNDDGQVEVSRTRSEAWNLGHGQPVVKINGYAGGIALERITSVMDCKAHDIGIKLW